MCPLVNHLLPISLSVNNRFSDHKYIPLHLLATKLNMFLANITPTDFNNIRKFKVADKATAHVPFLIGGNNQCFYKPGTSNNPYYHNVGLLNVNEKIVTGATIGGSPGAHRGDNPFYAFDLGRPIDANEEVLLSNLH